MKNKSLVAVLSLALVLALGSPLLLAQNNNAQFDGMPTMSPDQRVAFDKLWNAHQDKMQPLRDQLWAKQMMYDAMLADSNTKPADVEPLINEMVKIKDQMRSERDGFRTELDKQGFDQTSGGPGCGGRGYGHDGYGMWYKHGDNYDRGGRHHNGNKSGHNWN